MSSSDPAERAAAYEIAFEEGGRALDAQERAVNELRTRGGVLIAAAAIVTSFFGSRAVSGDDLSTWAWIAVVAFVLVGACVLMVLWPRSDWSFNANARDIVAEYIEPVTLPVATIHRDLALHRAASFEANAQQLGRLYFAFRLGLVLLVAEVAAWLLTLAQRP